MAMVELMLALNMGLVMGTFLLLSQPSGVVEKLVWWLHRRHEDLPMEALEAVVRRGMHSLGLLFAGAVFVWGALTAVVIELVKSGRLWRL